MILRIKRSLLLTSVALVAACAGPDGNDSADDSTGDPALGSQIAGDGGVIPREPGTGPGCGAQSLGAGSHRFTLRSANGITYKYDIVVPPSYVPTERTPTVFFWHALTSGPKETRNLIHVDQTAEARRVITVHPESPDASWDTGSCCTGNVLGRRRNEEIFARELVEAVKSKVCVDSRRVYTTGFSNGGMMSQYLACKAPDLFAAAVAMSGTLTIPKAQCRPSRAIPLLMINGTADPLVGYNGTSLSGGLSAVNAYSFWAQTNTCQGKPVQTLSKGKATCTAYQQCRDGVEVGLCTINGMGHCVAGMKKASNANCLTRIILPLGRPNDDIDGYEVAMDFLLRWTLP